MKKLILLLFIACSLMSFGQKERKSDFGIKFSGFIKSDHFYDTRQMYEIRDRHFTFYPKPASFDNLGNDINLNPSLNFLAIQSRVRGTITGPEAFGAKATGILEADFFGNVPNIFRIRHAIVKFNWERTELIFGQYWHAMFITDCFPGTINFNTGAPFQPFSRNPQIRITHSLGRFSVMAAAMTQRDFQSPDAGFASLSNSALPDIHAQAKYKSDHLLLGAGLGYKSLKPSLTDAIGNATDEKVQGLYGIGYLKLTNSLLTFKLEGMYGQNMHDHLMISGYAYSAYDPVSGLIQYTPVQNYSVWTELHTNGKKLQFGIFAGYTKNLGALEDIVADTNGKSIFTRFSNDQLDFAYRISPRVVLNSGKTRFALELEHTTAAYASSTDGSVNIDSKGRVTDSEIISNLRLQLGVFYLF